MSCANPLLALSTAEGAVAMIMAGAWELKRFSGKLLQGEWSNNNRDTVPGLAGQTIGIIGYGEISKNVIRMLSGFPATVKLASRYCTSEQAESLGGQVCSLEELLSSCRIISIHSTLTPSSRGMIGRAELELIQDGAVLVNTARAEIIDEAALLSELRTGRFSAVLDVYHQEPLPAGHPLLQLENVLCLPHIAGFSVTRKQRMGQFVAEDLQRFIRGEQPLGRITAAEYSRQSRH
ncbi:D-3-phosphoglycerate dehydrogenase [compost metagenome]